MSCSTCSGYYTRSSSNSPSRSPVKSRRAPLSLKIRRVEIPAECRPRDPRSRSHRFVAPDLHEARLEVPN